MQLEEIAKAGRFRLSACAGRCGATVSRFYERAVRASPRGCCWPAPADERKRAELELLLLRRVARRGPGGLLSDIHGCTVEI